MNDWYSSYLFIRQRQRELIRQAEQRRLIAAARRMEREGKPAGRLPANTLRHRLGRMLIVLGRSLQQQGPGVPLA